MKLKLLKEYRVAAVPATDTQAARFAQAGDVIEIEDQATCDQLMADGTAETYTAEMEAADNQAEEQIKADAIKAEADRIKAETKSISVAKKSATKDTGVKTMKGLIGKAIKQMRMEGKAVGDVAGTTATEYMGYVAQSNKLWDKLGKMTVNGNLRVVYANGVPTISTVTEGNTNAQSATPIAKTCTLVKKFASFSVPTEYFEDVDGMDAYLSGGVKTQVYDAVVAEILTGAGTGATIAGFEGIENSGDIQEATFASLTAPTQDELLAFKAKIHPKLANNITFIVSPAFWAGCEKALLTSGNIGNQLIVTGANPKLFGYDVIIDAGATAPICGDLSQYIVGVGRDFTVAQVDAPATDSVITSVSVRAAGAIAWKKDATYAAFAVGVVA